eukprot:scaffold5330_cov125-Isochrysis_galbana.AAC.4
MASGKEAARCVDTQRVLCFDVSEDAGGALVARADLKKAARRCNAMILGSWLCCRRADTATSAVPQFSSLAGHGDAKTRNRDSATAALKMEALSHACHFPSRDHERELVNETPTRSPMKALFGLLLLVVGASALKTAPAPALRLRGGMDKTPPEAYQAFLATGVRQATMPTTQTVLQALLAGGFVALGAALAMTVGANVPGIKSSNPGLQKILLGAFGLPWALLMVLLTGGQLFTGNTATITTALLEGQVTLEQMLKNLVLSYFGNFAGGLTVVYLLGAAGLTTPGAAAVAVAKTSLPFMQALIRGFLCNWMVCIAIWQAYCATTVAGKYISVFFTISSFVALGFEHSVANMAMIPLGMLNGADISVAKFLTSNLIPVTIGNMLAGSIVVGTAYYYIHGSGKKSSA